MTNIFRASAVTSALAVGSLSFSALPAAAYPVDCAILLCLAGGWPGSEACTDAYAEFLDRITPWPIEPPLQIWRCPMGASFEADEAEPMERLRKALFLTRPLQSEPIPQPAVLRSEGGSPEQRLPEDLFGISDEFINEDGAADMDISGPVYDFVRSIRVYMVSASQFGAEDNCNRTSSVRVGSYGSQGEYRWRRSTLEALPPVYQLPSSWGRTCPIMGIRSVVVEWRDNAGTYGWDRVDY